jgi:hypothetical protein
MRADPDLHGTPVVLLEDPGLASIVVSAAARAVPGGVVREVDDAVDRALLDAAASADVVLVVSPTPILAAAMIGEIGGRALPVLAVGPDGAPSASALAFLADPGLSDLFVAIPVVADGDRAQLWGPLRDTRAEERHQLVEVDARAAVAGSGSRELAAAAAGILAARLAAARRRWLADLDS